jgi:protease I
LGVRWPRQKGKTMTRLTFVVMVVFLLAACQPTSTLAEPTLTSIPATSTSAPNSPTETQLPPTSTQIPPTEPVVLTFERTGVILLIVSNQFDPVEFNGTQSPLLSAGYEVIVAAFTLNPLHDNEGGPTLEADIVLSDVQVDDYDAIVFIGNETLIYLNDPEAHRIAQEAVEQGRVLAGLCHGPLVLAEAGVLEGRQATAWFGFGNDECKKLQRNGAICTYARVQQDGLIITGKGPDETAAFVGAIKSLLHLP